MSLSNGSAVETPDSEWSETHVVMLENLLNASEKDTPTTTTTNDDESYCDENKSVLQWCSRCEKLGTRTEATLLRYCPYRNCPLYVCNRHQRCYSPHAIHKCGLPGHRYRNPRVRKNPDRELAMIIKNAERPNTHVEHHVFLYI